MGDKQACTEKLEKIKREGKNDKIVSYLKTTIILFKLSELVLFLKCPAGN